MLIINIGMTYLEKISTTRSSTYNNLQYAFSDAMDHPGLIGIFYNNPEFGDEIKKQCKQKGIGFGERFGAKGVSVEALLQLTEPMDNYWFEISPFDFMSIPTSQREQLISVYNIIVFDYIDGGYHVELVLPKSYLNDNRILNASGAMDKFGNETLNIPVFPHITYMEAVRTENTVPESIIDTKKEKLCLFPNHKPRPGRLATLARLHELEILDEHVDWSLTVNWDEEELESLSKFVVENIYKLGVEKLLESVEEKWGTNSKDVLNSIINLETFYLNLTTARSDDVN